MYFTKVYVASTCQKCETIKSDVPGNEEIYILTCNMCRALQLVSQTLSLYAPEARNGLGRKVIKVYQ